jgi:transposase
MFRILYRLLVGLAQLAVRTGRAKDLEIVVLRHQVAVLQRTVTPTLTDRDRSLIAAIGQMLPRSRRDGWIITPDTVLRWHRRLIARRWTHPHRRAGGRPRTSVEIRDLVIRMATDNPTWGYRRVTGELACLGHAIAASTVWQILRTAGIAPSPTHAPYRRLSVVVRSAKRCTISRGRGVESLSEVVAHGFGRCEASRRGNFG